MDEQKSERPSGADERREIAAIRCPRTGVTIIGLGHRKRQGKDWCAAKLASKLRAAGIRAEIRSFAWKLKMMANELYGWAGLEHPFHYEVKPEEKEVVLPKLGMSPREVYLTLGTRAIRQKVYGRTWCDYLLKDWLPRQRCLDVLIIPDLRFPDEMEAIHDAGGYCIKVERTGIEFETDIADEPLAEVGGLRELVTKPYVADGLWWDEVWSAGDGKLGDLEGQISAFAEELLKGFDGNELQRSNPPKPERTNNPL